MVSAAQETAPGVIVLVLHWAAVLPCPVHDDELRNVFHHMELHEAIPYPGVRLIDVLCGSVYHFATWKRVLDQIHDLAVMDHERGLLPLSQSRSGTTLSQIPMMFLHVLRNTAYLCSTAARSTIHWTVLVVTAGVVVETLAYKLQYTVVIQSAIGYMCCSIATRNCNHNLFELISIHQLLNCNKRLQYVATQPAISAKSQKTRVYTVMLCIWVKNQPYMQTRSAWHVVEVVRPG